MVYSRKANNKALHMAGNSAAPRFCLPVTCGVRRPDESAMQLSESEARSYRNDFANRCFRDVADKDYVAARASYRFGMVEPFLWSALQATEKYLKAILLYNGVSTIGVKHDLVEAFERVVGLEGIGSDFPDRVREFLTYLKRHASSRYLERPYFTIGDELMRLVVGGTAR